MAEGPQGGELPYLTVGVRDLPELGRLTGKGDTRNLEQLLSAKPNLIIDFGTVGDTCKILGDCVESQTGIPCVLIDGHFANTPAAIPGVPNRGEVLAGYAGVNLAMVNRVLATVLVASGRGGGLVQHPPAVHASGGYGGQGLGGIRGLPIRQPSATNWFR